jgi:hypothetical protein
LAKDSGTVSLQIAQFLRARPAQREMALHDFAINLVEPPVNVTGQMLVTQVVGRLSQVCAPSPRRRVFMEVAESLFQPRAAGRTVGQVVAYLKDFRR